jgi:hypothetical protein
MTDAELLAVFETGTLAEFRHRDHVRVGFAMLARDGDLAAAALAFRAGLRRLAGDSGKYHETITWAYLVLIAERMHDKRYASSEALLAAHPDLLDHRGGALAQHYDVAAITASPLARTVFVLP